MKKNIAFTISFLVFILTPAFFAHAAKPVKILIVPGHDNVVWGAQYGSLKEADMNLALATRLFDTLKKDKRFKVYITRDPGGYTQGFVDYFSEHAKAIVSFRNNAKAEMQNKVKNGDFVEREGVPHNNASEDVSMILYGINKWANENEMDAVIHVHFNDYRRSNRKIMGEYKGFAIYMPEKQMENSKESVKLAKSVFTQLNSRYIASTYPPEKGGLLPDQSLIALGSNDTLLSSVRSILIEYGYIYRFGDSNARYISYDFMSSLTAKGIKEYFFK